MFDGKTPLQKVIHKENHKRNPMFGPFPVDGPS